MEINNTLMAAVGSSDLLKQSVGVALLSKVKDTEAAQAATMLQDFTAAQHPFLGKTLDIKI